MERDSTPKEARLRIDQSPPTILAEFKSEKGTWRYNVPKELFMGCLAWATRISEAVSVVHPSERSKEVRYGVHGSDVRVEKYEGEEFAIFTINVLKRKGSIVKDVALPLKHEPYAEPLLEYFKSRGDGPVFPFSRQYAWSAARTVFDGLSYWIEPYNVYTLDLEDYMSRNKYPERILKTSQVNKRDGTQMYEIQIAGHYAPASDHFTRHIRLTELGAPPHNFTGEELGKYVKWSPRSYGVNPQVERYVRSGWHDYAKKLLPKKERNSRHEEAH